MAAGEKFLLVDGTSAIFRAFFALPALTNRTGFPTNVVYGFHGMIRKLLKEQVPDYLGVALDLPEPTFRHKAFPAYKAHRPDPPSDLIRQIPKVRSLCAALRIPILEMIGFEADDVLGTMARHASSQGLRVILVSTDKDLLQLVTNRVHVLNPTKNLLLDPQAVERTFGVRPDQVVDVLAIWGDTSDNLPGIPGIGEKGAKELIRRFGNLEECFRRASEIRRKGHREGLQKYRKQAEMCRSLVKIRSDTPLKMDLDALRVKPPDQTELTRLFEELEITYLLSDEGSRGNGK